MLQVAKAAREAGVRRKQLARSIASTASSSGSSGSGKRSSRTMEPTASTQVTPDPKQVCSVPPTVEPRSLAFDTAIGEGGVFVHVNVVLGLWVLYACMHTCYFAITIIYIYIYTHIYILYVNRRIYIYIYTCTN